MNKSSHFVTKINYLYLFLVINYQLVVSYITHIDSTGYLMLALSLLVLLLNGKQIISIQSTKPVGFWLLWCIYVVINYYLHPVHVSGLSFLRLITSVFYPLLTMTITVKEFEDNPIGLIKLCAVTVLTYTLLGYYFDRGILFRIEGEDNVLGNTYAIITCLSMFYLTLLQRTKHINLVLFVVLVIVVIVVLAMSGTRKAFGSGLIMLVFWMLSMVDIKKARTWFLALFLAYGVYWGYNVLIQNTFMGQRMEYYEEQQEQYLPSDAPEFLKVFGDRAPHYYYGWKQLSKNPFFGVGLYQSRVENGRGTKDFYLHTEYMAQLADNGIVGFAFFFAMYFWIGKHLMQKRKVDKQLGLVMIGGFVMVLFLNLTAWSWSFPHYFLCLGVLIGYCQSGYDLETLQTFRRG